MMNIEQTGLTIHRFFTDQVEKVAKATRFVQRASKLTGTVFLQAIVFNSLEKKEMTLSSLAQSCLDLGVSISEQGVDDRIQAESVAFAREMFNLAMERLRQEIPLGIELLQQFIHIYLVDSSQISLPKSMSELFPGSGGNASTASLKIQLAFDYLLGQFEQLELSSGREPDQGYRGHWSIIQPGVLFLMDLGYFVLDTFKAIDTQGGYFLSRFQSQTGLFDQAGQRLELAQMLSRQSEPLQEYEVRMGSRPQHQIPCRLIAVRLSQKVADRQRQKAKENARRHGRTPNKESLKLLDWALFVTNVPAEMLHTEHVPSLYRIRWQIELIFKMCKSFCALDYVSSYRPHRILTEFYARLIGVILTYFLIAPVRLPFDPISNREISPSKVRLIFQRFARLLALSLQNPELFVSHIRDFFTHVEHFGFKQKRRKSPNATYALALISACYDWDSQDFMSDFPFDFSTAIA